MLCLMTGTAGDRAVGTHDVDGYICTTYFDMLVDKLVSDPVFDSDLVMSKYRVAPNMDAIPGVKFYQYDQSQIFASKNDLNPSHNKWAKDPSKAEAHVKTTLGDLFGSKFGSGLYPAIEKVIGEKIEGIMMFIPRTTKTSSNKVMDSILRQIREVTNEGYYIIELTGRTTNGEKAELYVKGGIDRDSGKYVKGQITIAKELKKIPLIVSAGHIGSRSFSIPEINVALLMYDGGSAATTGQNMSRPLTRGQRLDKVGHVISLSVDPTREDSMVQAVLETATKVADETGEDIVDAIKRVLRSMNIHALNSDGEMVEVRPDDYTAKIMDSSSIRKVVGATTKVENIMGDAEKVQKLLGMMGEQVSLGKADSIGNKGKTFAPDENGKVKVQNKNDAEEKEALNLWNKIKAAVKIIADNAQNVAAIANSDKFTTALETIVLDSEMTADFEYSFNVDPEFVMELVDTETINGKLLDLIVYTYSNEQKQETENFLAEFT